jgi:hypothetical protein
LHVSPDISLFQCQRFPLRFQNGSMNKNVNQGGIRAIKLFVFCDAYRDDGSANVSLDAGATRHGVLMSETTEARTIADAFLQNE